MRDSSKNSNQTKNSLSSEDFNLANIIRSIVCDYDLSPGAIRILIFLVLSSGRKGYTYMLVDTIGQRTRTCRTQTKHYIKELEQKNRIKVIRRPGRSSIYQIVGIYGKPGKDGRKPDLIKQYTYKNKTVSKPEPASPKVLVDSSLEEQSQDVILNTQTDEEAPDPCPDDLLIAEVPAPDPGEKICKMAEMPKDIKTHEKIVRNGRIAKINKNSTQVEKIQEMAELPKLVKKTGPAPQRKRQAAFRFDLVRELLDITRDHKSLGFWIKLVRHVDPETICYLISSLRLGISSGLVEHRGRYLVGICRRVCPWVFEIQSKKQALRASQQQTHGQLHGKVGQSEPVGEPDFETGLEQIRKIRELLGRKVA